MTRWIIALAVLTIALCSPALSCEYPLETEKAKWAAQGYNVGEISAPAIIKAIQVRWGETIEADQVFVLSQTDAPNVALVFSTLGCLHSVLIIATTDYRALVKTSGA